MIDTPTEACVFFNYEPKIQAFLKSVIASEWSDAAVNGEPLLDLCKNHSSDIVACIVQAISA